MYPQFQNAVGTLAQLMKHQSPFVALSFPNLKKIPIYCWVDRESFPVLSWQSQALNLCFAATFCTITKQLYPLDHGAYLQCGQSSFFNETVAYYEVKL